MENMSYCRFENTLRAMRECYEHLTDENLSNSEKEARAQLIGLADDLRSKAHFFVEVQT